MVKFSIALVSDYFYPSLGGIETHIEHLALELRKLGNKVIIITHKYENHIGVRYINDVKVYYLDLNVIALNTTFPTLLSNGQLFFDIFTNEKIEIVHGHQTMSNLAIESVFHGKTMNLKTLLTEHSLFEIGGFENVIVNVLTELALIDIDRFICVSYTAKENLMARLRLPSEIVHVIPNGVIFDKFKPLKRNTFREEIRICVVSRFVKRKGIDILINLIPKICQMDRRIHFVVVGEGPKRDELEHMIDQEMLYERVNLLGAVDNQEIPDILRSCDIFLNTSLTEAFCIAILEACSCGLKIVSTNVGGVHEVLPEDLIILTSLDINDIISAMFEAINREPNRDGYEFCKNSYSWRRIAELTSEIYNEIKPLKYDVSTRVRNYHWFYGFFCRLFVVFEYLNLAWFMSTNKNE